MLALLMRREQGYHKPDARYSRTGVVCGGLVNPRNLGGRVASAAKAGYHC
jgi:hypothetical protein